MVGDCVGGSAVVPQAGERLVSVCLRAEDWTNDTDHHAADPIMCPPFCNDTTTFSAADAASSVLRESSASDASHKLGVGRCPST